MSPHVAGHSPARAHLRCPSCGPAGGQQDAHGACRPDWLIEAMFESMRLGLKASGEDQDLVWIRSNLTEPGGLQALAGSSTGWLKWPRNLTGSGLPPSRGPGGSHRSPPQRPWQGQSLQQVTPDPLSCQRVMGPIPPDSRVGRRDQHRRPGCRWARLSGLQTPPGPGPPRGGTAGAQAVGLQHEGWLRTERTPRHTGSSRRAPCQARELQAGTLGMGWGQQADTPGRATHSLPRPALCTGRSRTWSQPQPGSERCGPSDADEPRGGPAPTKRRCLRGSDGHSSSQSTAPARQPPPTLSPRFTPPTPTHPSPSDTSTPVTPPPTTPAPPRRPGPCRPVTSGRAEGSGLPDGVRLVP